MPLLCGIDEVGYGPRLGPLVVAATVFEVPDLDIDLWAALDVPRDPAKGAVAVCDSKRLYHPPDIAPLERTALAFWYARDGAVESTFVELLATLGPEALDTYAEVPWYRELAHPVPFALREPLPSLRPALNRAAVRFCGARAAVLDARAFNDGVDRLGNKADLLFELSGPLYRWFWEQSAGAGPCRLVVGKQGGRAFYAERLQRLFPETFVMTGEEGAEASSYSIEGKGRRMSMTFAADAEDKHFPVGLASIVAKYVREGLMAAFNRWWAERLPGLRPTAGYHVDAERFLRETESLRKEMGIEDRVLVRSR